MSKDGFDSIIKLKEMSLEFFCVFRGVLKGCSNVLIWIARNKLWPTMMGSIFFNTIMKILVVVVGFEFLS